MKENARELVLNILTAITEENAYSHILIREVLSKYNNWDTRDKDFIKRLTEGTLERMIQIDYVLDQFSKISVSKMKPLIRNLLRMSVYQILFMDAVPDSAACNEAVKLAGKRGFRNLQGYVNGVLRTIARQKDAIKWPDRNQEPDRYLSVRYSMPEWLIAKWRRELGEAQTGLLLAGLLDILPVTVRVKQDITREQRKLWLEQMEKAYVQVEAHPYLPYAYRLTNAAGIHNLPGYEEGLFMVQDVSSMLVAEAAEIKPADFVLDVCAAPGGKALHCAERAAKVQARDLTGHKAQLIRQNMERLQVKNMEIVVHDACVPDESMIEKADILLADLPCSGLGIIGKKRDIKYKVTPESIREIIKLQKEILSVIWQYVKPGGTMIYSTCTINREENEDMMAWFTEHFPFCTVKMGNSIPAKLSDRLPDNSTDKLSDELTWDEENGMMQLLPGIHKTDGFFICKLKRK